MDAKLKADWVAALRSGKYQQGTSYLRRGDRFCCLGVLCDLKEPDGWLHQRPDEKFCRFGDGTSIAYLPNRLRSESGFSVEQEKGLAHMNDTGLDFARIADHIEKNL